MGKFAKHIALNPWGFAKSVLSGRLAQQLWYVRNDPGLRARQFSDVFIVSYPKSGRTWLRVMLGKYISDLDPGDYSVHDYLDSVFESSSIGPRIGFVHDCSSAHQPIRFSARTLPKDKSFYKGRKVVLLVRDLRDVLVSYYIHCIKREPIFDGSLSNFIRDEEFGIEKAVQFLNVWYSNRNVPGEFMVVRYEDIMHDPLNEFLRLVRFLGLPENEECARRAVEFSAFENMRTLEREGKLGVGKRLGRGVDTGEDGYKVRQGVAKGFYKCMRIEDVHYTTHFINTHLDEYFGYSESEE